MTRRRGSSAYEGKRRTNEEGAISLDKARRYRLVQNTNSIVLMCPKEGDKKEAAVDLSYLLAFPHLTEPFAQAVQGLCKSKALAFATCWRLGREMKTGFFAFLKQESFNNIRLEQLTTSYVEGFKIWLDRADEMGVAIYELSTREHHMSHLRKIIRHLKQSDKWAHQLASDLNVRPNMWTGQQPPPQSQHLSFLQRITRKYIKPAKRKSLRLAAA